MRLARAALIMLTLAEAQEIIAHGEQAENHDIVANARKIYALFKTEYERRQRKARAVWALMMRK